MPFAGFRCVQAPGRRPANKLRGMERLELENATEIEVLDGQISVEELLTELGFEWRAGAASGGTNAPFSQPALF